MRLTVVLWTLVWLAGLAPAAPADTQYGHAPIDIQASLFIKLFVFNNDLAGGDDLVIHVIDAPELAAEMRKSVGQSIGTSRLAGVTEGDGLPETPPSVIYLGRPELLDAVTAYTHDQKILSITGLPELVARGITLGVGTLNRKPRILFNVSASEKEGMNWNPVILKITDVIK